MTDLGEWVMNQMDEVQLEHSSLTVRCHPQSRCNGSACTLHNRTQHVMRGFRQLWRSDRGIMERTCPHGVGHPDPDDYRVISGDDDGVHGCCGCCYAPAVPTVSVPMYGSEW